MLALGCQLCIGWFMSSAAPSHDETSLFRESWGLYDALAEMNYMFHREIYQTVGSLLAGIHERGPWTMLDLGCGNARFLSPCLRQAPPAHYDGVDLSAAALEEARSRFLHHLPSRALHCQDMLEAAEGARSRYDVIFSSFAVHHLTLEAKGRLFRACSAALKPGGCFILVDVVRQEGQGREAYIAGYVATMRSKWTQVPAAELEAACAHVEAFDFPETLATLSALGQAASLASMTLAARHAEHHVLVFQS